MRPERAAFRKIPAGFVLIPLAPLAQPPPKGPPDGVYLRRIVRRGTRGPSFLRHARNEIIRAVLWKGGFLKTRSVNPACRETPFLEIQREVGKRLMC